MKITPQEAKQIMDTQECIIVDVRSELEYEDTHIKNAICIPVNTVLNQAVNKLPDKNALLLVYCRSGARSARACAMLEELGYTYIKDFGGLNTWPYETI